MNDALRQNSRDLHTLRFWYRVFWNPRQVASPLPACEILDAYQIRTGSIQDEGFSSIGHVKPDVYCVSLPESRLHSAVLPADLTLMSPYFKVGLWKKSMKVPNEVSTVKGGYIRSRRSNLNSNVFESFNSVLRRFSRHHRCLGRSLPFGSLISVTSPTAGVNRPVSVS